MNNFVSILKNTISEIEIKKSKFIGLSFFVESEFEAQTLIDKINKQYFDATHVCYAYVLKNIEKCSDNGEPSGTAGKPMLEVIKKMELKNVLIFSVRYFGGIKLGAGGLNRAYTDCAKTVLELSGKANYFASEIYKLSFNLGAEDKLFNKFYANKLNIVKTYYSNVVSYDVAILKSEVQTILTDIANTLKRNNFYTFVNSDYVVKEL